MKEHDMDAKRLNYFKGKLLQKRASLSNIVQKAEDQSREKDQSAQDMADMAVESYTKDFLLGKSAGDRQLLQQIQNALDRIDGKNYGVCAHCDDEINPKRLEAVPWAELCVKCQGLLEKGLLEL